MARGAYSGVAQWLACWAHNPKVRGSKPRSAIYLLGALCVQHVQTHDETHSLSHTHDATDASAGPWQLDLHARAWCALWRASKSGWLGGHLAS